MLGEAAHRFFIEWHRLLRDYFEEGKKLGKLRKDADCEALSYLVMSTIEGVILIGKASKDSGFVLKTAKTLKAVLSNYRV